MANLDDIHAAATFLMDCHKMHGLPETVPVWVQAPGQERAHLVLERWSLDEQIGALPADAIVEVSPFPEVWTDEDSKGAARAGVLIASFPFATSGGDGETADAEFWNLLSGPASFVDVCNQTDFKRTEQGGTLQVCCASVLAEPIGVQHFEEASRLVAKAWF